MIAVYWDDLDLREDEGKVYYLQLDPDTFIIQYEAVYQFNSNASPADERLTCQAILKSSGEVILQYKSVPTTEYYLVGMQNDELNQGVTVASNSSQITNQMGVRILPPAEASWLELSSGSGTSLPSLTSDITLTFDPATVPFNDYFGRLWLNSNDTDTPLIEIGLSMQGGVIVPEIEVAGNGRPIPYQSALTALLNHTNIGEFTSAAATQSRTYTIHNKGSADLNLGTLSVTGSDFGITHQPSYATLAPGLSTTFQLSFASGKPVGDYSATVTIPSDDSNELSFTFVVTAKNLSLLENWKLGHFSSSANTGPGENDADPDLDGMDNLMEYALGGDPLVHDAPSLLPTVSDDGAGRATFSFMRDPAKTDIDYTVQASETLLVGAWTAIANSTFGGVTVSTGAHAIAESGVSPVSVTVTDEVANPDRRFFRLFVELN
ncbi:choice-of-anchor D domain-containing protein [Rubritalea profundi]|nr:choice-of-anchor D domain-containing protein [Rubritalea profundi]